MRRQLNTLYVTTEGAWLRKDGANIVMEVERQERARLPAHMLESIVCIGNVGASPQLLGYCAEQGIGVCFLSMYGRFLARVEGAVSGNVLLRREQYRRMDDEAKCSLIVRNFLLGKVHNQKQVLGRALRDHGESLSEERHKGLSYAHKQLARIGDKLFHELRLDGLRGLEGEASRIYFNVFDDLIRVENPALRFSGRNRRPPLDVVNALLSFLYTLLTHDCRSALETVGLDPAAGFLHRLRSGRPSLALDLVEEFRPFLADRLTLSLINRRQVNEKDFRTLDNGAVLMKDEVRKVVLTVYQERKREMLRHTFLDEKIEIGLFPFIQAQLLARHLRGDLDAYPPFIWK
ncbi:MAG: type I-C CRISPR-associated endonuclease Cas1c [Burkholderiales bacterium]|jgi:CRISPR-associated protein Cas1|nr:type I-C CRISPR-associated endonuclease Cas1c [Burkholderiales bacterium]